MTPVRDERPTQRVVGRRLVGERVGVLKLVTAVVSLLTLLDESQDAAWAPFLDDEG